MIAPTTDTNGTRPVDRPTVTIPSDSELEKRLGVQFDLADRVRYVKILLRQVQDVDRIFDQYEREIARLHIASDGMRTELSALHDLVGSQGDDERNAFEQRRAMISQMRKAREAVDRFESRHQDLVRELRETLKKPERK